MRRHDIDWRQALATWPDYDLDALQRDIEEERMRRRSPNMGALRR